MSKYYDNLPEWALKFETRGRNVKRLNGHYYLYRCITLYDKETKVRKPTQIYLGYTCNKTHMTPYMYFISHLPVGEKKSEEDSEDDSKA